MLLDTPDLFILVRQLLRPMELRTLLDLGSSNRPASADLLLPGTTRHVCVDPCQEALAGLPARYETWNMTARVALGQTPKGEFDAILLLDVIEHMEKEEGQDVIELALDREPKVIVVFTPLGFVPQEPHEPGGEWQRHRSGWTPDDFRGRWLFIHGAHWQGLEPQCGRSDPVRCFFALWIAP